MTEIWKPMRDARKERHPLVDEYLGRKYEVSNLGRLRNIVTGRLLKGSTRRAYDKGAYFSARMPNAIAPKVEADYIFMTMGRIVLTAFEGPHEGMAGRRNGDPTDNRLENLFWVGKVP